MKTTGLTEKTLATERKYTGKIISVDLLDSVLSAAKELTAASPSRTDASPMTFSRLRHALTGECKVESVKCKMADVGQPADNTLSGTFAEVQQMFLDSGWTDGLPIVPPTEEAVAAFLRFTDLKPDHSLGAIQPAQRNVTVRHDAVVSRGGRCRRAEGWLEAVSHAAGFRPERFHVDRRLVDKLGQQPCSRDIGRRLYKRP